MKSLNYLMDNILYQISKIALNICLKNREKRLTILQKIYINKIESRIKFRITRVYYLELLIRSTRKIFGSTKCKITKDRSGEDVLHLEITEVVLVHCNIVNNDYRKDLRVLQEYTFAPNKLFSQLLDVSPKNVIFSKTFDSEPSDIEVWFTDENPKPLEIEDKISITLVINESVKYEQLCAI